MENQENAKTAMDVDVPLHYNFLSGSVPSWHGYIYAILLLTTLLSNIAQTLLFGYKSGQKMTLQ